MGWLRFLAALIGGLSAPLIGLLYAVVYFGERFLRRP